MKNILASVALAGILTLSAGTLAAQAAPGNAPAPPSSTDSPVALIPGQVVAFSGSGFTPGETIDITVTVTSFVAGEAIRSLPAPTTTADASGAFLVSITLEMEEGTYSLTATGRMSGVTLNDTVTGVSSGPVAGQDVLADTGVDAGAVVWSLLGVGAIGAGVGLVTVSRRRDRGEHAA